MSLGICQPRLRSRFQTITWIKDKTFGQVNSLLWVAFYNEEAGINKLKGYLQHQFALIYTGIVINVTRQKAFPFHSRAKKLSKGTKNYWWATLSIEQWNGRSFMKKETHKNIIKRKLNCVWIPDLQIGTWSNKWQRINRCRGYIKT